MMGGPCESVCPGEILPSSQKNRWKDSKLSMQESMSKRSAQTLAVCSISISRIVPDCLGLTLHSFC